jgi:aspartyl-tRNA(Asn)/glutamyl-tRNA(Gln) amidotransferase subunit A
VNALAIVADLRRGARSAREVLAQTLALIDARDGKLNCFTHQTLERARREASAIDAARARGEPLPPLAGVPYVAKNLFDIEGVVTLAGARLNEANPPAARDAFLIERMREAGAILLGAVNMDENAYGFTCENTHYGATRNPHELECVSGGSSGGSAAAVGGGLVPLSLGSDTSGSIRVPASFCGIFGMKPTYGRLSRGGTSPFVDSLDHVGPFATNVADLRACYEVLQGQDPSDHACAQRPFESGGAGLPAGTRIGVLEGWFHDWAGPAARQALALAAAALGAAERCQWSYAEAARGAAFLITGSEGGALHRARLRTHYDQFEPASRDRLVAGSLIPAEWLVKAQRVRRRAYSEALRLFERFDLLLAPAAPLPAPRIGTDSVTLNGRSVPTRASLGVLTQPISAVGLPACTAPLWPGGEAGALPIGVQLIGAPWREDLCLAGAEALEQAGLAQARAPAAFA